MARGRRRRVGQKVRGRGRACSWLLRRSSTSIEWFDLSSSAICAPSAGSILLSARYSSRTYWFVRSAATARSKQWQYTECRVTLARVRLALDSPRPDPTRPDQATELDHTYKQSTSYTYTYTVVVLEFYQYQYSTAGEKREAIEKSGRIGSDRIGSGRVNSGHHNTAQHGTAEQSRAVISFLIACLVPFISYAPAIRGQFVLLYAYIVLVVQVVPGVARQERNRTQETTGESRTRTCSTSLHVLYTVQYYSREQRGGCSTAAAFLCAVRLRYV